MWEIEREWNNKYQLNKKMLWIVEQKANPLTENWFALAFSLSLYREGIRGGGGPYFYREKESFLVRESEEEREEKAFWLLDKNQ